MLFRFFLGRIARLGRLTQSLDAALSKSATRTPYRRRHRACKREKMVDLLGRRQKQVDRGTLA